MAKTKTKLYTWIVCEDCAKRILSDLCDHDRLIIKCPAYAYGECSVCYNSIRYKITVQQDTQEWLLKFTFKKEQDELAIHNSKSVVEKI